MGLRGSLATTGNGGADTDLEHLWRIALSRPLHGGACGCAMPAAMVIGPRDIERDILDYLDEKHGLGTNASWRQALQAREAAHVGSLPTWLAIQRCAPELRDIPWTRLLADVATVLDSMSAHAGGRLVAASNLQRGWLTAQLQE